MSTFNGISELCSGLAGSSINSENIIVSYNSNYPSFILQHIFENDRRIIDCVKVYNKIWSIRQNTNLIISSFSEPPTNIHNDFGNIHASFYSSSRCKLKSELFEGVRIISNVKRMYHSIDVTFDGSTCFYNPNFTVYFDFPFEIGVKSDIFSLGNEDIVKFINFLLVYSSQTLMVIVNHYTMKAFVSASIKKYVYTCSINFNLLSNDSRTILVGDSAQNQNIKTLEINRIYPKFFEG